MPKTGLQPVRAVKKKQNKKSSNRLWPTPLPQRNRELAKIHIAAKDLGLDDDAYRAMLWTIARVRTAKDLDADGRARVLDHLKACGFKARRAGAPHNLAGEERGPQLHKIEALLAAAGRPWEYADGMAQRMFRVDRITFCNPAQLQSIIAALVYDAKRHNRNA